MRVYIKRGEDFSRCKAVCEGRFGQTPTVYAIADVCREELLVEIEALAFSRRVGGPPNAHKRTQDRNTAARSALSGK